MSDARVPVGTVQGGFVVYDDEDAPVTGLTQDDFDVLLAKDGADSVVPVTLSEVGAGRYHYAFAAEDPGVWYLVVRIDPENPRGWSEDLLVYEGSVVTFSGSGAAPKKYWKTRPSMSNGFELDGETRRRREKQKKIIAELMDKLERTEGAERQKLMATLLLHMEDV